MSSSIYNKLLRFSLTNLRSVFPPSSSEQDETHYQHGIPGIPTDGKVVLLKNSNNGAQIYLVGTVHISEQSAETVKKVIDYVRPDVVAVELCKGRAEGLMDWKPEDDTLYKLFREAMRAPGGLCMKIGIFFLSCWYRRLHADGTFLGLEFKVAIEESSRVGATYFCIDQDNDVTLQQVSKVFSFNSLWKVYTRILDELKKPRRMIEHHRFGIHKIPCEGNGWLPKEILARVCKFPCHSKTSLCFRTFEVFKEKLSQWLGWVTWMELNYCGRKRRRMTGSNVRWI
ncbi:hypothetical protein MKW92_026289 [Papaver armeniacum]|nr:hypothetical protein MKW92_026289 [Papaver armeniacum]